MKIVMTYRHSQFPLISVLALLICSASALAQTKATVSAALNFEQLQPGQQAALAVVVEIPAGLHAQSSKPLDEKLIAFSVKVEPGNDATIHDPIYPEGKIEEYPALGTLSVYEGKTIAYVPLTISPGAAPGPITFSGKVRYQLCNDQVCFAPVDAPFKVETVVVVAGEAAKPANAELFRDFDPRVFAKIPTTAPASTAEGSGQSLLGFALTQDAYAVAFIGAFLVGMLFNVMPCVLPIVPLKAMGFFNAAHGSRARSLSLGAAFCGGLIATFGVLALMVVVFNRAWGEFFGNPWFAGAIVIVLAVMALNTFGAFATGLPTWVYRVTPREDTYTGNFLFGILTALLSTPCTFGMFLGLLVWAAAQPPALGTAVIMTVGVGMASPYLLLSALPELAKKFPRTGPWAQIVKQVMGFLLLGTAVYFGRRFYHHLMSDAVFWWMLFAVVAAAGAFMIAQAVRLIGRPRAVMVATFIAAILVVPAFLAARQLAYVPIPWRAYTADALAEARKSGKPVLIKFTAVWCGNCQAVEATVFTDDHVIEAVDDREVVTFKADLTEDTAPGWDLLRTLHPVGAIPFTAVYLPGAEKPRNLSGIYQVDDLLRVLNNSTASAGAAE